MSKRVSTARYFLPIDVNPPTKVCFQIEVPNDIYHIAAFMGQIYALARAYSWADDPAHTAKLVAAVWMDIFDNLKRCPPPPSIGGADEGVEQLIRQNPDNPCLLETSINGTDWCVFADLSKCAPAGSQPGSGAEQPPAGGGEACYNARLSASDKWLLPYQVNTGDVIVISEANGSWTDGSGLWQCPNGQSFFLGACTGATTLSGSDPAPSLPHSSLIAKIGSVYYAAYNASITVPAGISHANMEFQMNDPSLTDNYGEVTFKACVTNNAASVWEHDFDFTVNSHGWRTNPGGDGNRTYAVWTAGVGWVANCTLDDGGANYYQIDSIRINTTSATTMTSIDVTYTRTAQNTPVSAVLDQIYAAASLVANNLPQPNGTNLLLSWAGSQAVASNGLIQLGIAQDFQHVSGHSCPLATPAAKITRAVFRGTGVDPFL